MYKVWVRVTLIQLRKIALRRMRLRIFEWKKGFRKVKVKSKGIEDVCRYYGEKHMMFLHMIHKHPSMNLGVKWDLYVLFVQTAVKCQDCKFVWANCTVYCSNKMLQRLVVTNPKNDKVNPHGVNPTLSIFFQTPIPSSLNVCSSLLELALQLHLCLSCL